LATKNEPERFVSRGKTGRQMRKVRKDGWTARKREIFLDHYAASGNAAEACRAAGMSANAAAVLRRRDPEFAAQYDAAHEMSKLHLEELTIQYAKTGGRTVAVEPGEIPPVNLAHFDPELALRILQRPRPSLRPYRGRTGRPPQRASKAELIAAINKLLDVAERRQAKREG
jgi:hypothetical protein